MKLNEKNPFDLHPNIHKFSPNSYGIRSRYYFAKFKIQFSEPKFSKCSTGTKLNCQIQLNRLLLPANSNSTTLHRPWKRWAKWNFTKSGE